MNIVACICLRLVALAEMRTHSALFVAITAVSELASSSVADGMARDQAMRYL